MTGLRRLWLRASGMAACAVALALPHGPRMVWARVLAFLSSPGSARKTGFFRRHLAFWNRVVLGLVFHLGFPLAHLMLRARGGTRVGPDPERKTYWVPRSTPESFARGIDDPF